MLKQADQPLAPKPTKPHGELSCFPLSELSWKPEDCESSLNAVFKHVRQDALNAIGWYVAARRPKRRLATGARLLAVTLLGAAALLPLMEGIIFTRIDPIWISLTIAAAAAAIGLDRALGSSSGWIRCIQTELQLRDALEAFELEWETARASWRGECPSAEQTSAMLQSAKTFAARVNIVVQEETNAWVNEFRSSISQLDERIRNRAEARERSNASKQAALNGDGTALASPALLAAGFQAHEWKDDDEKGLL